MINFIFSNLLAFCLLVLAGIFYFFGFTSSGFQIDIWLAEKFAPGKLHIASGTGQLLNTFTLNQITYEDPSVAAKINSLSLAWHPSGLLVNKIWLDKIVLDHADIQVKETQSDSSSADFSQYKFLSMLSIQYLAIHDLNITNADAKFYFNGTFENNWHMQWNIAIPHLAVFANPASGALFSSGQISGPLLTPTFTAVLQGEKINVANLQMQKVDGKANIVVKPGTNSTLSMNFTGVKLNDYALKQFNFTLNGNVTHVNQAIQANLSALVLNQYRVDAAFALPRFTKLNDFDQPFTGKITSAFNNLALVTRFIPQIKNVSGTLQTNVIVAGSIAQPRLTGNANLTNGKFSLPLLGLMIDNIHLQTAINQAKKMNFSGQLRSGKGNAEIKGTADFSQPTYPIALTLQGQELQAVNLPEYKVVVSPKLALQFAQQNLHMQGNVVIPYAKITPKNFSSTVILPADVVFVDDKKTITSLPFTTSLQLNLQLGDHIQIAYENLETNLGGSIQVMQEPDGQINAAGELHAIDGTYTAYGKTLTIQRGRLIYTGGSLMNPGLNIAAIKKIKTVGMSGGTSSFSTATTLKPIYTGTEEITVGVQVTGTLDNPVFSLFSTPTLSQGDILSYILLGYPQSAASGQEAAAVLSAISALNQNGPSAGAITKRLEQKLGINELNVESTQVFNPNTNSTVSTTTVGIGKQLAPNLYIHYSIGLFYPVSILNLRYQFNEQWALQSETSTVDNGADLLYVIERD